MPYDIRTRLDELRQLRILQRYHAHLAACALDKASRGMSTRRATDRGGTGSCPLVRARVCPAQGLCSGTRAKGRRSVARRASVCQRPPRPRRPARRDWLLPTGRQLGGCAQKRQAVRGQRVPAATRGHQSHGTDVITSTTAWYFITLEARRCYAERPLL